MDFNTDIYDEVTRMRAATLLGDIARLHQPTKIMLRYFQTNSKYGNLVVIPDYDTQESFSRSARGKS